MTPSVQRPLRFGVAASGRTLPTWAAEGLRRLIASGHAEPVAFLRTSEKSTAPRTKSRSLLGLYEARWLRRRSRALNPVDMTPELGQLEQFVGSNGTPESWDGRELDRLGTLGLDFIWCLSGGTLPDRVLELPRLGVWQFLHDAEPAPFLWELLDGTARTRVALYRMGRGQAADACLYDGYFATCRSSWVNNLDRALLGSTDFLARTCAEVVANATDNGQRLRDAPAAAPRPTPGNRELGRFLAKAGSGLLSRLWELSFHVEVWNVGFTDDSVEQILRAGRVDARAVRWCPPHRRDHFIADPFVYGDAGAERVLVEDYVRDKGRICTLTSTPEGGSIDLAVDFEFPFHLSYPCIFREGDRTYCIPEAYQSGRATLYERVDDRWLPVRTLLEGQPVVDPTLFRYEDRYWLFYTLQNDGAWGNQKLYAHYAERLDAEWHPHALNPLKCDIGSTRPAGNLRWIDGALYRPSQDCSRTYGGALVMNRIVRLSPTEFEEVAAKRIEPIAPGPYPAGLHTLNAMGERAVIDGKKFAFDPLGWRKNWGRRHEVFS